METRLKMMTNQDTIIVRVLKAKYFPTENFLKAKLEHNPSFVWRSIHVSWVGVTKGLQWRLGNGNSCFIYSKFLE